MVILIIVAAIIIMSITTIMGSMILIIIMIHDHQMSEGRKVRLLLDWSSAEIFIDNGLYAMTSRWR